MRTLITGGCGFIGSHLAEALFVRGDEVSILDDLTTGSLSNLPPHALKYCTVGTVLNRSLVFDLVDDVDIVFHFAGAVGVRLVLDAPICTIETNVSGTINVLQAAVEKKTPVFIASTSEVYGKSDAVPFREDGSLLIGPPTTRRWSYACSKIIEEFLGLAYYEEMGVPIVIGRFFNVTGPRQSGRYGMVLPTFINQALGGGSITVFGDGTQRRTFCYITEAVNAVLRLMDSERSVGEVVNIGNDEEITILKLARLVREVTQPRIDIKLIPYEQAYGNGFDDTYRRKPCLKKLYALTGYRPSMPVQEIVDRTVQHIKDSKAPG